MKIQPKYLILLIIGALFAGFWGGRILSGPQGDATRELEKDRRHLEIENSDLKSELDQYNKHYGLLKEQFSTLAKVDLNEYMRLKNEEEQLNKAKEMLGKVFLILFARMLPDLPQQQLDFARTMAGPANAQKIDAAISANEALLSEEEAKESTKPQLGATEQTNPAKDQVSWTQAEKGMATLTPERYSVFLANATIHDLHSELRSFRKFSASDNRIKMMQGTYMGDLIFLDDPEKIWHLEMTLATENVGGVPTGEFLFRMFDDKGTVNSNHSSNGDIRQIMQPTSVSKAIIIKAGDSDFFQMYLIEAQDIIIGNYYNQSDDGKTKRLGSFQLKR